MLLQRLQTTQTNCNMNFSKKMMPSVRFFLTLGVVLLVTLILGFFTGCSRNSQVSQDNENSTNGGKIEPKGKAYFSFFDTVSYVYSYAGDSNERFDELTSGVSDILDKYHKLFDIYYEYSGINNLCTVNKMAGGEPVKVDKELIEFLLYCKEVCDLTAGMVDVMMGSVLSIWHDARTSEEKYLPEQSVLDEASQHMGFDFLEIDEENCTVRITDSKASLDVGAIGKGYATEKAAQWLEEQSATSYVLNIGGNVRIVGSKPSGEGWVTGIRDPKDPDSNFAIKLMLSDTSCVTSGEYERFFTVNGKKYSHIIDPNTLWPAQYFASLSVITKDSGYADSLSTALYCMDYEKGLELVSSLDGVECVWIFHDGEVKYTPNLESLVVH